ncbi:MAG: hypothetical protein K2P42_10500 [Lachnospiraceae bacterium]|nr:hypothetical protein [Lachnospiraceae bacterium]MDE7000110.1 hypothetical protein [Lachnospiraceae bacterium]
MEAKLDMKKMGRSLVKFIIAVLVIIAVIAAAVIASKSGGKDSLNVSDLQTAVSAPGAALSDKPVDTSRELDGHHLVAANDSYELYLYEPALSIIVRNTETGAVMESTVRDEERLGNVNETWKGFLQSGIVVELQEETNTMQRKLGIEGSGAQVSVEMIPGGFRAKLDYPAQELGFEAEIKLYDDGSITAHIPESSIYENADNKKIGNIYVFPLLGSSRLGEKEGYMFVPDGNGALIYLDDKDGRFDSGYVQKVYGPDIGVGESYVLSLLWGSYETHNDAEMILAPIYGMVHTDDGMGYLAVIESGDEEASIYATPNGAYSDYNWITAAFRKCTTYIQPTSNSGGSVTKVTDRIQYDINVRYMFVDGSDANYTGLAKRYRDYLIEKDELVRVEDDFKVRLDFLGLDVENWMLWKKDVPVTTVDNIREIYADLEQEGVTDILSIYKGWQDGGIFDLPVTKYDVAGSIGGARELSKLMDECAGKNIDFYLFADGVRANTETGNTTFDTVKKMDKRLYTQDTYQNVYREFVYWTPQKSLENLQTLQKNLGKKGVDRIALSEIGNTMFTYTMGDTMQTRRVSKYLYEEALRQTSETMDLMLEAPVQCYWQYAKAIVDMPIADSDYIYTDQSVPFLSIALKGILPMYGDYVNFEANERAYFLKLVETGIYPSFYLTYENPSELIYTNSSDVYTSQYSVYRGQILSYYDELKQISGLTKNSMIVNHEISDTGVTIVTYDNGVKLYINYNETEREADGVTVPALSYVIGGE